MGDATKIAEAGGVSTDAHALLLRLRGTMELVRGEFATATTTFQQALDLTTDASPRALVSRLHIDLGNCYERQDDIAKARAAYRETLEFGQRREDPYTLARSYLFLASLEEAADPEHCLVLLDQSRELIRDHALTHLQIYVPLLAGQAKLCLGDGLGGADEFREGLRLAEEIGEPMSIAAAHVGLGEALAHANCDTAAIHLDAGVQAAMATKCLPYVVWAAWVIAHCILKVNPNDDEAATLLSQSVAHPNLAPSIRPRAIAAAEAAGVIDLTTNANTSGSLLDGDLDQVGEQLLKLIRFH